MEQISESVAAARLRVAAARGSFNMRNLGPFKLPLKYEGLRFRTLASLITPSLSIQILKDYRTFLCFFAAHINCGIFMRTFVRSILKRVCVCKEILGTWWRACEEERIGSLLAMREH